MLKKISSLRLIWLIFILGIIFLFPDFVMGKSADAIAMRVIPNPEHYSALRWYNEKVSIKGSPQLVMVDGYDAVRDGRTVYVNAANVDLAGPNLYTNIYIISYNQSAEKPTEDIFGQILANWRFNDNLETQTGTCSANTNAHCLTDKDCFNDGYCQSFKAKVVRDTIRLGRLTDVEAIILDYKKVNQHYPILIAGSYLPNRTISVWPSWQDTLGKILITTLPVDPINKLTNCPGFNKVTCWNENNKSFAWASELNAGTIPNNNFVFLYRSDSKGNSYNICTNSETGLIGSALVCNSSCVPFCFERNCGGDGCGGSCGSCTGTAQCISGNCLTGCSTAPGCHTSLANATAVTGYCASGRCYVCDNGYHWNGSACISNCLPDGCNGVCPFSCTTTEDPDCGSGGCCGDTTCGAGETVSNCPADCSVVCIDNDHDGYGSPASTSCTHPELDCNDNNANIHSGATEICDGLDNNCNGQADEICDLDNDNYCDRNLTFVYGADLSAVCPGTNTTDAAAIANTGDCNDNNPNIHPGVTEICDGVDNNCNGTVDEGCDNDDDNYCGCSYTFTYGSDLAATCSGTNTTDAAAIANTCDCNESNNTIHPGASEICGNSIDEDCSGSDLTCAPTCADNDHDGYGNPASSSCLHPELDCNDNNANIHPGAIEICGNGIDEDCNGSDQSCAPTCTDNDHDGYGNPASTGCTFPQLDCDDTRAFIHPGATETCDNYDNNCNGQTDEGCDDDSDDYCDSAMTFYNYPVTACPNSNLSDGMPGNDCNDSNTNIHSGATEICGNGIDEDCSGSDLACPPPCNDNDHDGYGSPASASCSHSQYDCNDSNANIHPGATEICDGIDNNCDGTVDEGCDIDNDNYCGCGYTYTYGSNLTATCSGTNTTDAGSIANTCDCNDNSASIYPGAIETCGNGIDEDCNGSDFACPPPCLDTDNDGFGNPGSTTCPHPQQDCNNNNPSIYPGAVETCGNGIDEDCDGSDATCPIPGCTFTITFPCIFGGSTSADTIPPILSLFSVTAGSAINNWTVTDSGGSHLDRIEIWRALDNSGSPGSWSEIVSLKQSIRAQNLDNHTGTAIDNPTAGTYWYGLHAVDQSSNCTNEENKGCTNGLANSQPSRGPIKLTISPSPDTQAPTIPTNLTATAISSSQINLAWTASTDNVGVTGYRIYRCQGSGCTPSTQIGTSATNSYSNTGLTASTAYVYQVAAYDAAGNPSAQSTSASATTQASATSGLGTPTITATAKGPNQVNLTWSVVANPGWGYKVEIQSDADSRYSSWTELPITRSGRNYLPYWVTESHYKDVIDGSGTSAGSAAQFQMYGLKYGTLYNFRVRTYGKTDAGADTYGSYSNTASATTTSPSTIRYVVAGGTGNGTSWTNAWPKISSANGVTAGTLVLVRSGNYAADNVNPTTSGTQASHTVFQAEPVLGTVVTITSVTGGTPSLYLTHSYVVVDGINVANSDANNQRVVVTGTRNAVVDCDLSAQNAGYGEVVNVGSSYNLFHYNAIHDGNINDQEGGFTMTVYGAGADYNVVQYNHIYRGGHDTGLAANGADYNQWKNNQQDGGYGLGWECVANGGSPAPTYNLYEGNIAMHTGDNQPGVYKPTIEVSGTYTTVRRNLLIHGSSHGIELSALHAISANHNLIYNNVIYANGQLGQIMFGSPRGNNVMTNNIYYANVGNPGGDWGDNLEIGILDTTGAELFQNNVVLRHHGGADYPNEISCARIAATATTAAANAWAEYEGNITTNPGYIDEANFELHLKSTSAIRGQAIAVTDATWGTVVNAGDDIGAFKY